MSMVSTLESCELDKLFRATFLSNFVIKAVSSGSAKSTMSRYSESQVVIITSEAAGVWW